VQNRGLMNAGASAVDLKVPITISDELSDEVITGTAVLNLASGEIQRVEYPHYDVGLRGLPWEAEDYEFTSGTLSNAGKEVEFSVVVNRVTGQYSVSASELLEVKVRAAALFAGERVPSAPTAGAPRGPLPPGPGRGRLH
jgi:hypothetical protein